MEDRELSEDECFNVPSPFGAAFFPALNPEGTFGGSRPLSLLRLVVVVSAVEAVLVAVVVTVLSLSTSIFLAAAILLTVLPVLSALVKFDKPLVVEFSV